MLIRGLDFIQPSTRLKIASNGNSNCKQLPNNWAGFARLTDIRSGEGITKFNPYSYQRAVISSIENAKTTIITKGRQLGLTESISNYFLWKACTKRGYLGVIFSRTQSDTSNIAKRLRRMVESLAEYVTPVTDSLTDLELSSGGRILFRNSTAFGSRGLESVSDILFDEASYIDGIEEIYKSAIPTTSMLGDKAKIIILSTPNGQQGWYFDKLNANNGAIDLLQLCEDVRTEKADPVQIWTDSKGWNKVLIHYKAHPIYGMQKDYLQRVSESTGLPTVDVQQEYDLDFTDSSESVFSAALVRSAATLGELSKTYRDDADYYIGVDGATVGNDYTVAIVLEHDIENDSYAVVDIYRKRKASIESDIYQIGVLVDKYKPRRLTIESNGVGQIFLEQLVRNHPDIKTSGFHTSQESKLGAIERLVLALDRQVLLMQKNSIIAQELLSFRRVGKRLEACSGQHDDTVLALAICLTDTPFAAKRGMMGAVDIQTF
jgi:hypothetical protein